MSERETALKKAVMAAIPTSWLDELLTGPHAVIGKQPYVGTDIERLLAAVRKRVRGALTLPGDAPQAAGADPVPVCQWREIATAPKDGTRVLVMWEYWSADPFVAYFKHGRWNGEVALSECSDDGPTHWMPLPAPPVVLVPAEGENQ